MAEDRATGASGGRASKGDVAADQLRLFIERIERLEEEKKGLADDVRDVYAEAKANGYDPKVMRLMVRCGRWRRTLARSRLWSPRPMPPRSACSGSCRCEARDLPPGAGARVMPPIATNDGANDARTELPQADTARRLVKILIGHLGVSEADITPDVMLTAGANGRRDDRPNLGADSLDVVELAMAAEDEFGIELLDDEIEKLNIITFGDLVDVVHAKRRERGEP
jgi:acyl carrier protein